MLIALYLILGHLVGDFLLQSSKLVALKQRSNWGLFLHIFIIFLSHLFFFIPFLNSVKIWIAICFIGILHYIIDYLKIRFKQKYLTKSFLTPFCIDQILHYLVLLSVYFFIKSQTPTLFTTQWWFESLYQNSTLLLYLAGVIFFSYTLDIIILTRKLKHNPNFKYQRGYFKMILRVAIFAFIYVLFSRFFG